ncbi:MAG: hypothetical protein B7Z72_15400, partial [Gemmatimonadetes bacterium 21-71-4]
MGRGGTPEPAGRVEGRTRALPPFSSRPRRHPARGAARRPGAGAGRLVAHRHSTPRQRRGRARHVPPPQPGADRARHAEPADAGDRRAAARVARRAERLPGLRGALLDAGRHFFPVPFVKRFVDLLSRYKLNVLHWHLTEDQGWRLEVPKWPRLTSVGAWRTEQDGARYGGFYTRDDVRDVVERMQLDIDRDAARRDLGEQLQV